MSETMTNGHADIPDQAAAFTAGTRRTTLNAYGETVCWIGKRTEYEHALWLKCESEAHLRSILDFQTAILLSKIAVATGVNHGWPKTMPWQIRLMLFWSSKWGWTPKRGAQRTIAMNVHQVMNAVRDIKEWEFACIDTQTGAPTQ